MVSRTHRIFSLILILILTATAVSACSTFQKDKVHLYMLPMDQMTEDIQSAPVAVREAYQFASINPDIMKDIPCYCGCGKVGHTSNYDCYVSNIDDKGVITFDNHALGCSICVDITQDVMRMLRDGKSPQDARVYVDATYSKYGTSNIP
jgi:predicted small secreted protein